MTKRYGFVLTLNVIGAWIAFGLVLFSDVESWIIGLIAGITIANIIWLAAIGE